MATNFVQVFRSWAEKTSNPTIGEFVSWLGEHCNTTPGDVMTDTEFQTICELIGSTPEEAEDALMETAWP